MAGTSLSCHCLIVFGRTFTLSLVNREGRQAPLGQLLGALLSVEATPRAILVPPGIWFRAWHTAAARGVFGVSKHEQLV